MLANLFEKAGILVAARDGESYIPMRKSEWPEGMLAAISKTSEALLSLNDKWYRVYRDEEHVVAIDVTAEFSRITDTVNTKALQIKLFLSDPIPKKKSLHVPSRMTRRGA